MKIIDIDGIVLTETNYSESSKILNVLTKDLGLIGVMSKGSRNMKSKLRGVSRKMIYGTFHIYYKENGLSTLIGVDVKNTYNNILSDLSKISYATYLLDLTKQVLRETEDTSIYDLLISTLNKIEEDFDPTVLTNILELKYLDFLGVSPNLDRCSFCGSSDDIVTLSSSSGGLVCGSCLTDERLVNKKIIQMIRMYYYVDIDRITKLDVSDDVKKEINIFLDDYYDRYTGLYLKTREFMKKVNILT
ncbi:MAG: DNA repair protein RecO [Bacilli bacterium]|nr:DNA repair protein RecO [Bacilli bacterium]